MKSKTSRVVIVEHDVGARRMLTNRVGEALRLELAGEGANGSEAIDLCAEYYPEVILIGGISTGETEGIATIQIVHKEYPTVRIIALLAQEDATTKRLALEAGAMVCLPLQTAYEHIIDEIYAML
jgi:DNA-binding NarL/FixJ family response regulator